MLIYIDNTISEYLQQNKLNEKQQILFSSLALSYYQGKCLVFGHDGSIKALIHQLGIPISGIYQKILSKYSEIGSVVSKVAVVFVITYDPKTGSKALLPAAVREKSRVFSVEEAARINWSNGTCFVGENISDCLFYEYIGKYYSRNNKIRNVSVFFHQEPGGGGDTATNFEKCVKTDSTPTLCIVDGDMKYGPTKVYGDPPKGGTYIACNNTSKQLNSEGYGLRYSFYPIAVHEVENLVPLSLLQNLNREVCSIEGIGILEELERIDNGLPILFYDFKEGITVDLSTSHGKYWDSVFKRTTKYSEANHYCKAVGAHFMENVIDHIKRNGLVCLSINPYLIDVWNDLGKIIFSWGCSSCPTSA